jgi:NADH-quinone oxidoreductase subunit H
MIIMCILNVLLFWGGWLVPSFLLSSYTFLMSYNALCVMTIFLIKILFYFFLFVLVRGVFPRYRYDQLMDLGWKVFLPFTLAYFYLIAKVLLCFDGFYYLDSNFLSLIS